ncbi:permease, partial [Shigella boydii]
TITYLSDTGCLEIQGASLNGFYLSASAQNGRLSINAHLVNHFTLQLSIMMSDQNYM